MVEAWPVVERILAVYLPDWRDCVQPLDQDLVDRGYRWERQREAAQQCRALLKAQAEVDEHLGAAGPALVASQLHAWVWDAARPAWGGGNFEDAVDAAARNVNSRLRAKLSRKDIGEADLVAQAFSDKPGDLNNPRLRLPLPAGLADATVRNIQGGVIAYGKGLFQAVRNPLAHEAPADIEMAEGEALECLAAFSLLARWIDRAEVHRS